MRSQWMYALAWTVLLAGSQTQSAGQVRQKAAGLTLEKLELHNVKGEPVTHLGRSAVRITDAGAEGLDDAGRIAIVPGSSSQDGTIEVTLTGDTAPDARPESRGFVGTGISRVCRDRLSGSRGQIPFRVLVFAPEERAVRGPIATKSFSAVHLHPRIPVAKTEV